MSFLILLLLIVGLFFLWPAIKVALFYRRVKKNFSSVRDSFNRSRENYERNGRSSRRKIFDKNIGEYVSFEEINATASQYSETVSDRNEAYTIESQTIDVEWEEI